MTPEIPTRQHEAGVQRPAYGNPYLLQIARLETELEAMRQRAEAAEAALGQGDQWDRAVKPLSLQMTRIMRLLAHRPLTSQEIADKLITTDYPNTSVRAVHVRLCQIRQVLPGPLMPMSAGHGKPVEVRDPGALRAFLAGGQMPMARAA
jgi:hypothetical protein